MQTHSAEMAESQSSVDDRKAFLGTKLTCWRGLGPLLGADTLVKRIEPALLG